MSETFFNTVLLAKAFSTALINQTEVFDSHSCCYNYLVGWLVGRFNIKIGYIGDKVLGGDFIPPG